jgi:hypothetical protein
VVSITLPSQPNVTREANEGLVAWGFAQGYVVTVTRQVPTSAAAPHQSFNQSLPLAAAIVGFTAAAAKRTSPASEFARKNERRPDIMLFIIESAWKG